jgi:hypothetical protein
LSITEEELRKLLLQISQSTRQKIHADETHNLFKNMKMAAANLLQNWDEKHPKCVFSFFWIY